MKTKKSEPKMKKQKGVYYPYLSPKRIKTVITNIEKKVGQKGAASLLGVSTRTLRYYKTCKKQPSPDSVVAIKNLSSQLQGVKNTTKTSLKSKRVARIKKKNAQFGMVPLKHSVRFKSGTEHYKYAFPQDTMEIMEERLHYLASKHKGWAFILGYNIFLYEYDKDATQDELQASVNVIQRNIGGQIHYSPGILPMAMNRDLEAVTDVDSYKYFKQIEVYAVTFMSYVDVDLATQRQEKVTRDFKADERKRAKTLKKKERAKKSDALKKQSKKYDKRLKSSKTKAKKAVSEKQAALKEIAQLKRRIAKLESRL